MRTTIVRCSEYPVSGSRSFCNLPEKARQRMEAVSLTTVYPPDATLFAEGEPARGVFVLCSGRVKLSASSPNGRTIVARFAKPGEALGVAAAILNDVHALTAETTERCRAGFIRRDDFLRRSSSSNGATNGERLPTTGSASRWLRRTK